MFILYLLCYFANSHGYWRTPNIETWFVNEQKFTNPQKVLNLFIGDDIKSFKSLTD